jgi:hypothetical protein
MNPLVRVPNQLFSIGDRTRTGRPHYSESFFSFWDAWSAPFGDQARHVFEAWYARYPNKARDRDAERRDLRQRIRSDDFNAHSGAVFELTLHELFVRLGLDPEVHPDLGNGSTKRPDFRIVTPSGSTCIVEAASRDGLTEKERYLERHRSQILDAIDGVESPSFSLHVSIESWGREAPLLSSIRLKVQAWVSTLPTSVPDPDSELNSPGDNSPETIIDDGDWRIHVEAWRLDPSAIGPPADGAVGSVSYGIRSFRLSPVLQQFLRDKSPSKYGTVAEPFVLAFHGHGSLGIIPDKKLIDHCVLAALFGQLQHAMHVSRDNIESGSVSRAGQAGWTRERTYKNTRISALLVAENWGALSLHQARATVWHHPGAARPLGSALQALTQQLPINGRFEERPGTSLSCILGLSTT